jgi:hypothetical protein
MFAEGRACGWIRTPRNSLTSYARTPRICIAILLLSAYIEVEHAMELLASGGRVGYLLKSRVTDVEEFYTDAEPGRGGAVIDPSPVHELVPVRRRDDPRAVLPRRSTRPSSMSTVSTS